jgi:hypothetical protein
MKQRTLTSQESSLSETIEISCIFQSVKATAVTSPSPRTIIGAWIGNVRSDLVVGDHCGAYRAEWAVERGRELASEDG